MDTSDFPLTDETFITIVLEDVNDETPFISEPNVGVEISESTGVGSEVRQILVTMILRTLTTSPPSQWYSVIIFPQLFLLQVHMVVASDADIGNNSALLYFIQSQLPEEHFIINGKSLFRQSLH